MTLDVILVLRGFAAPACGCGRRSARSVVARSEHQDGARTEAKAFIAHILGFGGRRTARGQWVRITVKLNSPLRKKLRECMNGLPPSSNCS